MERKGEIEGESREIKEIRRRVVTISIGCISKLS
jgi:hypothetical protein